MRGKAPSQKRERLNEREKATRGEREKDERDLEREHRQNRTDA